MMESYHKKSGSKKDTVKPIPEIIEMGTKLFQLHRNKVIKLSEKEYTAFIEKAEASMKVYGHALDQGDANKLNEILKFAYYQNAVLNFRSERIEKIFTGIDSAEKYFALFDKEPSDKFSVALKDKLRESLKVRESSIEALYEKATKAYAKNQIEVALTAANTAQGLYPKDYADKNHDHDPNHEIYNGLQDLLLKLKIRELYDRAAKQFADNLIEQASATAKLAYAMYPSNYLGKKHNFKDPHYQTFIKTQDLLINLKRAAVKARNLNRSLSDNEDSLNPAQRAYRSAVSAPVPRSPRPTRLTTSLTTKFSRPRQPASKSVDQPQHHGKKFTGRK